MSTGLMLTIEEFDRMVECGAFDHLNRKVEFIRGELRQMSPAGPLHNHLVAYLHEWSIVATSRERILVRSQSDLVLTNFESRLEPDCMWLRVGQYIDCHPTAADVLLLIEVAQSTLNYDLNEKAELYAEAGIGEYWIVDANASCVHVFRDPQSTAYKYRAIANRGETLSPMADPNAVLECNVSCSAGKVSPKDRGF